MRPPCRELGWVDRPPEPQVQSPLTWAATGPVGGACGLTRDVITGQRARGAGMEHQLPRAGDAGAKPKGKERGREPGRPGKRV